MKRNRADQRGQVLAYSALTSLVFFGFAALAVDVGRHIFTGREIQAVADSTALTGATVLARGGSLPDPVQAAADATTFASQNPVEGATPTSFTPTAGHWDRQSGTFTAGSPYNAMQTVASYSIGNIFGLWSRTSTVTRRAVAAFTPAPSLPVALCNIPGGWSSGVQLTFKVSNQSEAANTAGWAVYDPGVVTFPDMATVAQYLPAACGGGVVPPQEVIGTSLVLGNGVGNLFNSQCVTQSTGLAQCLPGKTFTIPIMSIPCGVPMNGQRTIIGFVTSVIDAVGCDTSSAVCGVAGGPCIIGHVAPDCLTDLASCPQPGLVS